MSSHMRNQPCPCNSGAKYKNCHGKDQSLKTDLGFSLEELLFLKNDVLKIVRKLVHSYSGELTSHFPDQKNIIDSMYEAIDKSDKSAIVINADHVLNTQSFSRVQHSGLGTIQLTWSVPALEKVLHRDLLTLQDFKVEELMKFVDVSELNQEVLLKAETNDSPIYVIEYQSQFQEVEQWAVDGNHRITARYNHKIPTIKGYCFSEEQHIEALVFEYMRVAYTIRTNLIRMFYYRGGKVPNLLPIN